MVAWEGWIDVDGCCLMFVFVGVFNSMMLLCDVMAWVSEWVYFVLDILCLGYKLKP